MLINIMGNGRCEVFFVLHKSIIEIIKHRVLLIKRIKLFLRAVFFKRFMMFGI